MPYGYGSGYGVFRRVGIVPFVETTEDGMIIRDVGGISSKKFPSVEDILDFRVNVALPSYELAS